jgi:hypothetical protein
MTNMRRFHNLFEESKKLTFVEYEQSDRLIWRVRLYFEESDTVVLGVGEDADELTIPDNSSPRDEVVNVSDMEPWKSAIGKPLFAVWTMTNLSGGKDGIQLKFAENVRDVDVIVQLQGIGSTIRVFAVRIS